VASASGGVFCKVAGAADAVCAAPARNSAAIRPALRFMEYKSLVPVIAVSSVLIKKY
jgi:hypothetical protein